MDRLTSDVVEGAVRGSFGRPLRFFDEISSTNSEAMEWARTGAPEGALVATAHQTHGRGRWGRTWSSEPGKLLQLSLVLRPKLAPARLGLVTTALGVACARAIERVAGLRATIKWPNDVRVRDRKVAGILVETQVTGPVLDAAVAGIGINTGWSREEIPAELRSSATSVAAELEDEGREPPPPADLLAAFLDDFETIYRSLPGGAPQLVREASDRSDVLGRHVAIALSSEESIEGRALRLGASGELDLDTPDGLRSVSVGEVRRLR